MWLHSGDGPRKKRVAHLHIRISIREQLGKNGAFSGLTEVTEVTASRSLVCPLHLTEKFSSMTVY